MADLQAQIPQQGNVIPLTVPVQNQLTQADINGIIESNSPQNSLFTQLQNLRKKQKDYSNLSSTGPMSPLNKTQTDFDPAFIRQLEANKAYKDSINLKNDKQEIPDGYSAFVSAALGDYPNNKLEDKSYIDKLSDGGLDKIKLSKSEPSIDLGESVTDAPSNPFSKSSSSSNVESEEDNPFRAKKALRKFVGASSPADDKYVRIGNHFGELAGKAMVNNDNYGIEESNNQIDADIAKYKDKREQRLANIAEKEADNRNKMLDYALQQTMNKDIDFMEPVNTDITGVNIRNSEYADEIKRLQDKVNSYQSQLGMINRNDPSAKLKKQTLELQRQKDYDRLNTLISIAESNGGSIDNMSGTQGYYTPKDLRQEKLELLQKYLPNLTSGQDARNHFWQRRHLRGAAADLADIIQAQGENGDFAGQGNFRLHTPGEMEIFAKAPAKFSEEWYRQQGLLSKIKKSGSPVVMMADSQKGPMYYVLTTGKDGNKIFTNVDTLYGSKEGSDWDKDRGLDTRFKNQ